MERRLTTILAADIVGYSRLVGADEEGALALRRRLRDEIIAPLLAEHGGRVANTAGDSWLIEFPSAVQALRFAVEGQTRIEAANAAEPEARRMLYRVGINVGDVVAEGEDLLGDGVNIAARLEALAPPGGIVVSRAVRDQVRDRLKLDLNDLSEIGVKNIARPVRAFQVVRDGEARMKPPAQPAKSRAPVLAATALALALAGGGGAWWWGQQPDFKPVDPDAMAIELPERPSIAVLPFANLGGDAAEEWIGDGLTENIISTLSLSPDMVVMGRATSFAYKGRQVAPRDVAQELGVRYVLSGSVQKSGDRARITAELSDAVEGRQLWSFREDSPLDDIFAVQDRIAEKLFVEMQVSLTTGESSRTVYALAGGDFDTLVRVFKGRAAFQRFDVEGLQEAERIWTELREENPKTPIGPYLLGWVPWQRVILGVSKDPLSDLAEAKRLALEALGMKEMGGPYTLIATVEARLRQYPEAIAAADRALELNPGGADENALAGYALYASGEAKRGLEHMLKGMRLEPDYPEWLPSQVYPALLEAGRYDEAVSLAQSVLGREMRDARAHQFARVNLAAAYALKGDMAKAREWVADMRRRTPDLTVDTAMRGYTWRAPRPFHGTLRAAFIAAGLPGAEK